MRAYLPRAPVLLLALGLHLGALAPLSAQAFTLFSDDEARKAIIDLRQRVEASQQASNAALQALQQSTLDEQTALRRSLVELGGQIDQLNSELARLRGLNEQLTREVAELQRQQKDVQAGLDERLRQVEPQRITHDGVSFSATTTETSAFEAALDLLRRADFPAAIEAYTAFLRRHPESGYSASALYWLGNAHYAQRAYRAALETHRRLVTQFPMHLRTPEAMLAMANSQIELKDTRAARRTLEELQRAHPQSEAAAVARERLARLR
ncbi:tol-pal system protein YbgF [Hydrogenophaga sp.]|uniref:tol-pal system protein YbgF n=1 Tax=Hydrogenophaga sp. TaxID=1904254 RepID=UPI00199172BF|nr:tol-pal system protein YbgF [Hydrogenophaga sp.]MBD3893672.1 tol-pal system protein YbgF [Hydrogenophaga sp.]